MIKIDKDFLYRFVLLLLAILLAMNLLFLLLQYISQGSSLGLILESSFRATFFIMLLCMMVLVEIFLILLLRYYTAIGVILLSVLMALVLVPSGSGLGMKSCLMRVVGPFLANKYARLLSTDILMLFLLNSLLLSFALTVMLKRPQEDDKWGGPTDEQKK